MPEAVRYAASPPDSAQSRSSYSPPAGIGLGLSVAKGFIDAMHSCTITAEDTPGGGLTITVALPAHLSGAAPADDYTPIATPAPSHDR
ncbi:hypothetical protein FNH05_02500 [Amycolatopsis rhizosphaerae]|uniref:Uncharacterized protein n=1 Tax=Amycolatopsis rhizosphaerae TaxID=2053003 RepID=A0A558DKZ1_9PSEU|nr:hypothetical protein FNH05_02500 [Amycolatopsis rhizosphaerae]